MITPLELDCPDYAFGKDLDLSKVSQCINKILVSHFKDKTIVIRGIQSEKHTMSKDQLVQHIIDTGSDRYETDSTNAVEVSDKPIDLFGYACTVKHTPIVLPILEGFHKWKPKSLERPQRKVDIWVIYDAKKLKNVEYLHGQYGVRAKDGYVFKDQSNKPGALLGVILIQPSG